MNLFEIISGANSEKPVAPSNTQTNTFKKEQNQQPPVKPVNNPQLGQKDNAKPQPPTGAKKNYGNLFG